jgi:hypothetical protein
VSVLRVAPELSDPVGAVEVGEHEDVEELGAGSRAEGVQALPDSALELIGPHGRRLRRPTAAVCRISVVSGLGSGPEQVFKRTLLADLAGWQSLDVLPAIQRLDDQDHGGRPTCW